MVNKGYALYKKDEVLYILPVAYEYPDTRFVGFDKMGDAYKVFKLSDSQKAYIQTHDPKQDEKLKQMIFVGDYYLAKTTFDNFPTGKPYNQLPGGGGVYKETRKYNFIYGLFKNETILRALDNYATYKKQETKVNESVRKVVREHIEKLFETK